MMILATEVKTLRKSHGLKASELARRLGISRMYLYEIERGRRVPIRGYVLWKIADYFGVSNSSLLRLAMEDTCERVSNRLFRENELKGVACAENTAT